MHDREGSADISLAASSRGKMKATRPTTTRCRTLKITTAGTRSTMMPVFSCALSERGLSAEMVNDKASIGF